jgi:molecular chaperone DnaK (HSP70)
MNHFCRHLLTGSAAVGAAIRRYHEGEEPTFETRPFFSGPIRATGDRATGDRATGDSQPSRERAKIVAAVKLITMSTGRRLLVGLDLGTTNTTCSVAEYLSDGSAGPIEAVPILQLLHEPDGENCFGTHGVLPSVVGIDLRGAIYTGLGAKAATPELLSKGYRIVRDIKRQLGNPSWQLLVSGRKLRPKHISGLLLATVKRSIARAYPDAFLEQLVLTIPASFSSLMRQETLEAAELAGFDPSRIDLLDEPVAALLSELIENNGEVAPRWSSKPVLVFDMGGGTLDASVVSISEESLTVEILATSRYHEFAGNDIDLELGALVLNRVRGHPTYNRFLETDSSNDSGTHAFQIGLGLMSVGEQLKIKLSQVLQRGPQIGGLEKEITYFRTSGEQIAADFALDFDAEPKPPDTQFSVVELIEHLAPFMRPGGNRDRDIFVPVTQALARASVEVPEHILLAGAASYFPLVRDAIAAYFLRTPDMLDPVYAVSHGAVVWSILKRSRAWHITETLRDSIFLKRRGHTFLEILTHPSPIPSGIQSKRFDAEESPYFSETSGRIRLEFYQGESPRDPRLSLCHVEDLTLQRKLGEDARLTEIQARVDSNKVFHFDMVFEDRAGSVSASISFTPGSRRPSEREDASNSLAGLILNGAAFLIDNRYNR